MENGKEDIAMSKNDSTATRFVGDDAPVISTGRPLLFGVIAITYSAALGLIFYMLGVYSDLKGLWPIPELHDLHKILVPYHRANGAVEDAYHRLAAYRGKQEIECPPQTDRTLVLLIIGQSNAANSAGQRQPAHDHVVNYFDGKCYVASSPLLGTTSIGGESWTLLGTKLVTAGIADQVILVPSAMSGTSIVQWQNGGEMNLMLRSVLSGVAAHYRITHILWHQGENDFGSSLTKEQYTQKFRSLVNSIRAERVDAPIYVSVASRCELTDVPWTASNPIADAQRSLPNAEAHILQGVDTDALVGPSDRVDDCHFGASGQEKFANAWVPILASH
jgi:lysophospholipase L1-like esterase